MKKYVNGKLYDMTEEDIQKRNIRIGQHKNSRKGTSDYERRIAELEKTIETLAKAQSTEQDRGE